MILFNFGKKNKETKVLTCSCDGGCAVSKTTETKNNSYNKAKDEIYCVKILGAGCASCHQQYQNVKKAVENIGLNVEVEYITDMQKVMEYGVMSVPALVVNDKVVSTGKVLKTTEVEKLFYKLGFR